MNRTAPEGGQGLLRSSLKGIAAMMKLETPAQRYRREAAECELNAEKATNGIDRVAWQRLADDWTKLAWGAAVNPRLSAAERPDARRH
jgi:pyruvate/2-oxoglutarate/acetoin dehydrogenase E1 component